ncbi:MAG: heavy-metal-associated domain-containing protein [Actinomycetota bacterium]
MKSLRLFISVMLLSVFTVPALTQAHDHTKATVAGDTVKTESFKVWGECGMCKARIEKTVKAEGATAASWDSKTQLLTVTYNPAKTGKEALSKKLAATGHDTEKFKAPDEVYNSLPGCCHYERQK